MNKDKTNEIILFSDKDIIYYDKFNHTRKEKTPKEILSSLSEDELFLLFKRYDYKIACLVAKISMFETTSNAENKWNLIQLYSDYRLSKSILQKLAEKGTTPHSFYYTDISRVEVILTESGLLSKPKEKKKKTPKK